MRRSTLVRVADAFTIVNKAQLFVSDNKLGSLGESIDDGVCPPQGIFGVCQPKVHQLAPNASRLLKWLNTQQAEKNDILCWCGLDVCGLMPILVYGGNLG